MALNTKEVKQIKEITGSDDSFDILSSASPESVGNAFLDLKEEIAVVDKKVKRIGEYIRGIVNAQGKAVPSGRSSGEHRVLDAGSVEMKLECRASVRVDEKKARAMLEAKGLDGLIDKKAVIDVKEGVNPDKVPASLIKQMEKYFSIVVESHVSEGALDTALKNKAITPAQFKKVTSEEYTYALKVSRK